MPYPQEKNGNGRVTNAILATKLDGLIAQVDSLSSSMNRRTDFLEEKLELNVGEVREKCRSNGMDIARLDERQKSLTGIQAALTVILSSIAATVGAVFK